MSTARTRSGRTRTLDPPQYSMLRAMLEEQRRFRTDQIAHASPSDGTRNGRPPTDADREVTSAILRAARIALHDIEAALTRMDNGTYGKCVDCGRRLPTERLEVLPQAAQCMDCQRAAAR
ncbi:MAG TPA: TraR/DksA C4-type zinc finger protein [Mycobacteriales bacterium]|nr:TraR/DksA C4-type zinc finger protein [Mycobacteriales bacterium]